MTTTGDRVVAAIRAAAAGGDAGGLALNPAGPVGGILNRADVASMTGTD